MPSKSKPGPEEKERQESGDSSTTPSGVSSDEPSEGRDDVPPKQPGSPEG